MKRRTIAKWKNRKLTKQTFDYRIFILRIHLFCGVQTIGQYIRPLKLTLKHDKIAVALPKLSVSRKMGNLSRAKQLKVERGQVTILLFNCKFCKLFISFYAHYYENHICQCSTVGSKLLRVGNPHIISPIWQKLLEPLNII